MNKIIIENSIYYDENLYELNHFLTICTISENEKELRDMLRNMNEQGYFEQLEERGIRYGFGNNHLWFSEKQDKNEWKRILYIDFSE